jgi:hypothetical protein
MSTTTPLEPEQKRRKRPMLGRTRALLAGGLIAAVGIGGTLAAWNTSVLGEATVRGNDPTPSVLEIQDINGDWVSNDGVSATLIADLTYPEGQGGSNNDREAWGESRLRLEGVRAGDAFTLAAATSVASGFPADVTVDAFLTDTEPNAGTCAQIAGGTAPGGNKWTFSEGTTVAISPYTAQRQFTGSMDKRVCFLVTNKTPTLLTSENVDTVSFTFTATAQ